jgi:hypothetical protein
MAADNNHTCKCLSTKDGKNCTLSKKGRVSTGIAGALGSLVLVASLLRADDPAMHPVETVFHFASKSQLF